MTSVIASCTYEHVMGEQREMAVTVQLKIFTFHSLNTEGENSSKVAIDESPLPRADLARKGRDCGAVRVAFMRFGVDRLLQRVFSLH